MGSGTEHIYLDHAATTPVRPEVGAAAMSCWAETYGNPSSMHRPGRVARAAVEKARRQVGSLLGCGPEEIVFTSGGTEANNMAVLGAAMAATRSGQPTGQHIVTTQVEHPSVLGACQALARAGFRVTYVPVDNFGRIDLDALLAAVTDDTILVSVMLANNEVGTVQPLAAIARGLGDRPVLLHTDAVQAVGQIPVPVAELGVDLLSLSGHKIYAPKGVGALYMRRDSRRLVYPLLHGGGQEGRLRPGTENVPGIVALGVAAALAAKEGPEAAARLEKLRDQLIAGLTDAVPGLRLNGHPVERLPNNVHITIDNVDSETLLIQLDLAGVAAASGSACAAGAVEPSHVLLAMGQSRTTARQALRLTLGRDNDKAQIDMAIARIGTAIARVRGGRRRGGPAGAVVDRDNSVGGKGP